MGKKQMVKIELCGKEQREYKGRLLGLINQNEFFRIMNSRRLQTKLFSHKTVAVKKIADYAADLEGLRIVLAIKEIEGSHAGGKNLFITEPLGVISHVSDGEDEVGILSEEGEYLFVSEEN